MIPDMGGIVLLVVGAFEALATAKVIEAGRTKTGPDHDYAEFSDDGLKDGLAKAGAGLNGKVGIVRDVGNVIGDGDLAIEELAEIEMLAQAHAAQFLQMPE